MDYFIYFFASFALTVTVITALNPVAKRVGLVDVPNERKLHVGQIPLIGGVAIFLGVLAATSVVMQHNQALNLYLISSAFILFLGVLDDKYDLSVKIRIVAQILIASIMIFGANYYLSSLGDIFHFFELKLGVFGMLVTVFAVIGAINAFNMVDGIDGLAGSLSLVTFTSLAYLLFQSGSNWFYLAFLFIPAILAYLSFNLRWPFKNVTKIFMGDAGSMLIGLTVVWLLVIGAESDVQAFSPVTALYLIAIPLMDMTAIMYRRIKKGQSPFKPDRDHLHHIFERAGYTRRQTLVRITVLATLLSVIGILGQVYSVPESIMFIGFIVLFIAYNWALLHIWQVLRWLRKA